MSKQSLDKQTIFIEGMHCAACEILIEKVLLKIDGIEYADVSLASCSADIFYKKNKKINQKELKKSLQKLNYKVLDQPIKKSVSLEKIVKSYVLAAMILIVFVMFEKLQLGRFIDTTSSVSFFTAFVLGLIASLSSCAALIGGILLSLSKHWKKNPAKSHFSFHLSRLVSFLFFGGVLGMIGSIFSFDSIFLTSLLVIVVSVVMLIIALQMLGFDFAQKIKFAIPKKWSLKIANTSDSPSSAYLIGALTFILPCGFTLIAQGAAIASGSFLSGAAIMLGFALGTLPALFFISITSMEIGQKPHLNITFNQVVGFILIFFSLYNINSQLNVLGLPSFSDFNFQQTDSANIQFTDDYQSNGEQIIQLAAKDFSYFLNGDGEFQSGVPSKLIVDNQGVFGCAAALSSFGLIDDFVILKPGQNVIDLGSPKPGNYKITCSMGMVSPISINFKP